MFAAGPLYPKGSQIPEAGMFVLRANSFEEAEEIGQPTRCTPRVCAPTRSRNGA